MDDATKELCYSVKLAVIKAIVQMPNEQVLEIIEKTLKETNNDIRPGRNTETEADKR